MVSGSFRNLAGPIQAVNAAASTITVNDTATKKPVVISVTPDSEVKKLDPAVAQRLAARMNGGGARRPDGSEPGSRGPRTGALPVDLLQELLARIGRRVARPWVWNGRRFSTNVARPPSVTLKDLSKGQHGHRRSN